MPTKKEPFLTGLFIGLVFFFFPILQNGNFGIPWIEGVSAIFGFVPKNFFLSILLMGGVYVFAGILPFSIYYFLRRKKLDRLFFSFLFFSLGLLTSYLIVLFVIALAFGLSHPTVL